MDTLPQWLLALALISLVVWGIARLVRGNRPPARPSTEERAESGRLYRIASRVYERFRETASPDDLLGFPAFIEGVEHLNSGGYSNADLIHYYHGDNATVACMALEALSRRRDRDDTRDALIEHINAVVPWTRYFVLRALGEGIAGGESLVGPVVAKLDGSWDDPFSQRFFRDFVRERVAAGESPRLGKRVNSMQDAQVQWLLGWLPRVDEQVTAGLISELGEWQQKMIDVDALNAVGSVWQTSEQRPDAPIEHDDLRAIVATLEKELQRKPCPSFLIVGEHGVGKTAIVKTLGRRLQSKGWTIFEAGRTELLAGMSYVGQLESRLRDLVRQLGGRRRVVWVVPDFRALTWAGRHEYSPAGVLDFLLPFIERGELTVIGEITPGAYQKLLQAKPRCRSALQTCRVEPLDEEATLELAASWARRMTPEGAPRILGDDTLREAWQLTQQFQGSRAAPGNLLHVLSLTLRRLQVDSRDADVELRLDDLIVTMGHLTGLPTSILDDRQNLDLTALAGLFAKRVMGQSEAVDCLVERVAMIKAGVTDPTRPLGVFLFAGPTGTGKTEIAKTLAEFLFGSADRLVRLDMSELQDETSLVRILGDPAEQDETGALTELIRKEPFSIVLLDEFEKAHPRIWDLFLQVFDDGRLTDRRGRTSDFRHALIILTSNLGSEISSGAGLGFLDKDGVFNPQAVRRALDRAFRKEFLNRLDRIVVFRALSRDTMRRILLKELDDVFRRRGLRSRSWAAEWDESAIDFLLERGFTADLGARPLRRAIERYLLTPLAMTIVNHQFPEGDQFLFIRSAGDHLAVEFVDPDGEPEQAEEAEPREELPPPEDLHIEDIVLAPRGRSEELGLLRVKFDVLEAAVASAEFKDAKRTALELTGEPDFWDSPERFAILGEAEYIDRIETGLQTARSLFGRFESLPRQASGQMRQLLGRLAQQIYLLEHACEDVRQRRDHDAFLMVEAGHEAGPSALPSNQFAEALGRMYCAWGEKRGMQSEVLGERHATQLEPYRLLLSVSGYAAFALLSPEVGLHVFEIPVGARKPAQRKVARVLVVPQSESRPARGAAELKAEAFDKLSRAQAAPMQVVRHYRETPSPLVRDSRRNWRTGHLDRVLAGDFDLIV